MRPRQHPSRRRGDSDHGSPLLSLVRALPPVLVAPEGPREHLRNALAMVRLFLDLGEVMMGAAAGPSVAVPVAGLARIQARLEAAIDLLELDGVASCTRCRGTILPPARGGVPRGTCHCQNGPPERVTDPTV